MRSRLGFTRQPVWVKSKKESEDYLREVECGMILVLRDCGVTEGRVIRGRSLGEGRLRVRAVCAVFGAND